MGFYQCMLWIILICLNASTHRITPNSSTRAKSPGHRAAYTYRTSDRAENPYSRDTNTCWSRRSHRGRHSKDRAVNPYNRHTNIGWSRRSHKDRHTRDRVENPHNQGTNTCWFRRFHRSRHTRDQASHAIKTLIIYEKTQSTDGLQLHR